jgi:predicted ATPase
VLVTGEGGIGKSQLVDTLRSRVGREGFTRIVFRYSPYQQSSALLPVITHLLPRVIGRPPAGTAIIPASRTRRGWALGCRRHHRAMHRTPRFLPDQEAAKT